MHTQDWIEQVRGWLLPKLGVVAQWLEDMTGGRYYTESVTHRNQFVGRVPMGEEEFEKELHSMGFERNPMAAWKRLASDPKEFEEGSFRKANFDEDDMQLHIIVYDGEPMDNAATGVTYVYAHWEYRWDTHPLKHYNKEDFNPAEGVRRMKKLLDENGIQYEAVRP